MFDTVFVLLSFEGPDPYSCAGGLSRRVTGLASELAGLGFETHLFFVGDPDLPGHESRQDGRLHLHRWCQWLSRFHHRDVYDGEDVKTSDWEHSLPEWLASKIITTKVASGDNVVVMGEEWQTAGTVIRLHQIIERNGWQDRVYLMWNANNLFHLECVAWEGLQRSAVITTVSRYMRTVLSEYGVEPRVIPTGISEGWLRRLTRVERQVAERLFSERTSLVKIGSYSAKWDSALAAVSIMKRMGMNPLLLAAPTDPEGRKAVVAHADQWGLETVPVFWESPGVQPLADALRGALQADIVLLETELSEPQRQMLFNGAAAVLTSNGREPFGLTGLEAMASGGIAMVGCSGEDYATPGHDCISLQSQDPWEIVHNLAVLQDSAVKATGIRRSARETAARYTWRSIIARILLPALSMMGVPRPEAPVAGISPAAKAKGTGPLSAASGPKSNSAALQGTARRRVA